MGVAGGPDWEFNWNEGGGMKKEFTATTLSVIHHRLAAIPDEMGAVLARMAFSPNIKERKDFSCALFDGDGRMLAQAAHIPVHLGAMPRSVESVLRSFPGLKAGDVVLLNDPFAGGSHLPDLTMVSPLFYAEGGVPCGYVATRAHHADVGGMTPGSLPDSTSIYQEGLRIPPVLLQQGGQRNEGVFDILCTNSRSPGERRGDVQAQLQAHHIGEQRWNGLVSQVGKEELSRWMPAILDYAERCMEVVYAELPAGEWEAEDVLEGKDGAESDVVIHGRLQISGEGVVFDFSESDDAIAWSLNTVHAVCESAVQYVMLCLLNRISKGDMPPVNAGCFRKLRVITREGSVLNAGLPHAVAGGNVETSQRVVDVVMELLAQVPGIEMPAQSQGTMNNVTLGGFVHGSGFAYYETLGGGAGAGEGVPGADGIQVHMTNTLNTPVEALEFGYPMRIVRYEIREGSGGAGQERGGAGLIREWIAEVPIEVSLLTERRRKGPKGRDGGDDGMTGVQWIERLSGERELLTARGHWRLKPGEVLHIETPGGGGYGKDIP
jgi:N-methylhydantoinase B